MHSRLNLILAFVLVAGNVPAQGTVIDIRKPGATKSCIDLSGLVCKEAVPASFKAVLEADLVRSGWFKIVSGIDAAVKVNGSCTVQAAGLYAGLRVLNVTTGKTCLDNTFRNTAGNHRSLAHEVADAIVSAVKGVPGIASSRIVMVGSVTGAKELFVCDADGQNLIQITTDRSISISPDWGPGGKTVLYTSFRTAFPYVYSIDLSSKPYPRKQLTDYPGLNLGAAISPDGSLVALSLSKDGNPDLYTFSPGSSRPPTRITRTGNAADTSPSWSPDGRSIAYVSDSPGRPNIYIVRNDGSAPRRITFRGTENVAPDWGNNGLIAFSSQRGERFQIFTMNPDSGEEIQISRNDAEYEDPSWAPDGRHIVCTRTLSHKSSVYILDILGDPPIRLVDKAGDWHSPAWSP